MYTMTGLYSENIDDNSSIDVPADSENSENGSHVGGHSMVDGNVVPNYVADTVIKCHSRQPSTGIIDQRDKNNESDDIDMSADCGILTCRPKSFQKFARIKVSSFIIIIIILIYKVLDSQLIKLLVQPILRSKNRYNAIYYSTQYIYLFLVSLIERFFSSSPSNYRFSYCFYQCWLHYNKP